MNRTKLSIFLMAAASILILSVTLARDTSTGQAAPDGCMPTSLSQIDEKSFPVREPAMSSISDGASLQAVEDNIDIVKLYYADFSLCPYDGTRESFLKEGGVTVTIYKEETPYKDGLDFQEQQLAYYASNPNIVADVQPIEVNGHYGVGWGPYESASIVRLDGEVIENTPMPGTGTVRFYNEEDGTIYYVKADRSLEEILNIAKSIQS